jgi:hypothetical protein
MSEVSIVETKVTVDVKVAGVRLTSRSSGRHTRAVPLNFERYALSSK